MFSFTTECHVSENPSTESVTPVQHAQKIHQPDHKWMPMMMTNNLKKQHFLSQLDGV